MTRKEEQKHRIRKLASYNANGISSRDLLKLIPGSKNDAVDLDELSKEIHVNVRVLQVITKNLKRTDDGRVWKSGKNCRSWETAMIGTPILAR